MQYLFVLLAAADLWDPKLAAQYMDQRQKEWVAFKPAAAPGGTCTSCHTGLLYAMARPALRKALKEGKEPNEYEKEIVAGFQARLAKPETGIMFSAFTKEPLHSQGTSVEAVMAAYLLPGNE